LGPGAIESASALAVANISKTFGATRALDRLSLELRRGEIHGLLGGNGSGKSTLIRILAGYHAPDPGAILEVQGTPVRLPLGPGEPRRLGLSFVHQDLGLIPSLSVAENFHLTRLATRRTARISWSRARHSAGAALERFAVEVNPRTRVEQLAPVDRALLAIVRALSETEDTGSAGVMLALDEPTVFLGTAESDRLFGVLRTIASRGVSVLFVSHELSEARKITDRVTVLRDGRAVATADTAELGAQQLVELIAGHQVPPWRRRAAGRAESETVVRVRRLSGAVVSDLSFELRTGEIVGLTGLAGSGYEEPLYVLLGASPAGAGTLELPGRRFDLARLTPRDAVAARISLVPADRQRDAVGSSLSVGENLMLPQLGRYMRHGRLRRRRLQADATALLRRFGVVPQNASRSLGELSGGNQQKAIIAKWLATDPRLVLLDEPSQGVDVAAREQILGAIASAAAGGACILVASTDHEQLAALCSRVLVLAHGHAVAELCAEEVTAERLATAVLGTQSLGAA
jgi:ribose transport system ATP-binding protein